jgi:predicted NodU family carbamoyl transferase
MNQPLLVTDLYRGLAVWGNKKKDRSISALFQKNSDEVKIEKLSNANILALANLQLAESQQETLHELLEKNSEGDLTKLERKYLDDLMEVYNDALLTKAKAMRVAVERGLMPPLSSE